MDTIDDYADRTGALPPLAIVIGNARYRSKIIKNSPHAALGAEAFAAYLHDDLGLPQRRIITRNDMRRGNFIALFGRPGGSAGLLKGVLANSPASEVIIYFSGRAMAVDEGRDVVLLTRDADFERPAHTGYRLSDLYRRLADMGVTRLRLYLDTAFSMPSNAQPTAFPPAFSPVASGPVIGPGGSLTPRHWVVFTASDGNQPAFTDADQPVSAFTSALIAGLQGDADRDVLGDENRAVTALELEAFLGRELDAVVRLATGGTQRPRLYGENSQILSTGLNLEPAPEPVPEPEAPPPVIAVSPSFDCTRAATPTERAICGNPAVATLDNLMVDLYRKARTTRSGAARRALTAQQRRWLRQRNACGSDTACLLQRYSERIGQIQ